ncbi:DMT family protein [Flavobacterium silvaticum]|uniref:DMT family protein n=1 Tax=Flavobacterium silvaticum TaxID=1852020 RepID=A0A972FYP3_9FLAO|nr:DMT family protein [Flavobacterium silvaticum]NMH27261.1 DMT family protein [Flavobacterium silvaticum]
MKGFYTIALLVLSNIFMTIAWYGHLKFKELKWFENAGLITIILISWGLAFFEYCFQVPANKMGYEGDGGPFSLLQLKVIQEVITLLVFVGFTTFFFKNETLKWNHFAGFACLVLAVYFFFRR